MTETILGVGISEFVANRQYAKIQYLQEENKQLQEQLKDMEKALKLNKEVLRLTLEQNLNNSNNSTNSSEQIQTIQLQMKFHEENEMLRKQMNKLIDERNIAQNKVLLSQQISEENQGFYKDLIIELEEKLSELRRCIQDKEYTIQDIEKNRGLIENGQMVKIREIVTPHEQSLRLHEELESTRQILNKLSQESQNLQEQNKLLKDLNQNYLRRQIKHDVILRSPLAYYKMKCLNYNDDSAYSDDNLSFHDQIMKSKMYAQVPNEQITQNQLNQIGYQQQQSNNMKYLTNNERGIYQEKLQKTEVLLKGFKELFDKEKSKVEFLVQVKDELEKKINECYSYNEIIIQGIKDRDQKIEQLQTEVQYYRTQFGNYMDFLKNKRKMNLNLSFQLKKQTKNEIPTPPPVSNNKILTDLEKDLDEAEQHISILDPSPDNKKLDESDSQEKSKKKINNILENNYTQMNQLEYKQFLLNTAKELFIQYNLKMNNLKKKQLMDPKKCLKSKPIWHAKSFSDPLDYFTLQYHNLQLSDQCETNEKQKQPKQKKNKQSQDHEKQQNNWDIDLNELSIIQGEKNQFYQ